jgi:hypothetical protein
VACSRLFVLLLVLVPGLARADVPPIDVGDCTTRKAGAACTLDGRVGECRKQTGTRPIPRVGVGGPFDVKKTVEHAYMACVVPGPRVPISPIAAPSEEPAKAPPVASPGPVLPSVPADIPASAVAPAPDVAPPPPAESAGAGVCRVAPVGAPGLFVLGPLALRRRARRG